MNLFDKIAYSGKTKIITLPSGLKVEIREANGADEELLSNNSAALNGMNLVNYIASVCKKTIEGPDKNFLIEEVLSFKVLDLYYATLQSRMLNFGNLLEFKDICQNAQCAKELEITHDLEEFCGNLEDPNYKPKNEYAIKKYPTSDTHSVFTWMGSEFRFKHLTREMEMKTLNIPATESNKNTPLIARELEAKKDSEWVKLTFFSMFSAKQMAELRRKVAELDPLFAPYIEVICPHCRTHQLFNLFNIRDFYYPGESL